MIFCSEYTQWKKNIFGDFTDREIGLILDHPLKFLCLRPGISRCTYRRLPKLCQSLFVLTEFQLQHPSWSPRSVHFYNFIFNSVSFSHLPSRLLVGPRFVDLHLVLHALFEDPDLVRAALRTQQLPGDLCGAGDSGPRNSGSSDLQRAAGDVARRSGVRGPYLDGPWFVGLVI